MSDIKTRVLNHVKDYLPIYMGLCCIFATFAFIYSEYIIWTNHFLK